MQLKAEFQKDTTMGGIPWLFRHPKAMHWKWVYEFHSWKQSTLSKMIAPDKALHDRTQNRIVKWNAALKDQVSLVEGIMKPIIELAPSTPPFAQWMHTIGMKGAALPAYLSHFHRDWVWGDEENEASLRFVNNLFGSKPDDCLVLGMGAGRLVYDLLREDRMGMATAADYNPLAVFTADKLFKGSKVRLYEFPIAPRSAGEVAVLQTLEAKFGSQDRASFVFLDACDLPYPPKSFSTVLTPWLIDVIPEPLENFCKRMNAILGNQGTWVSFGSCTYQGKPTAEKFSWEETLEVVAQAGFAIEETSEKRLPYLQSPLSDHGRVETVRGFRARKISDTEEPPPGNPVPKWLLQDLPIPRLPWMEQAQQINAVQWEILSRIDGSKNLKELSIAGGEALGLSEQEALNSISQFLLTSFQQYES